MASVLDQVQALEEEAKLLDDARLFLEELYLDLSDAAPLELDADLIRDLQVALEKLNFDLQGYQAFGGLAAGASSGEVACPQCGAGSPAGTAVCCKCLLLFASGGEEWQCVKCTLHDKRPGLGRLKKSKADLLPDPNASARQSPREKRGVPWSGLLRGTVHAGGGYARARPFPGAKLRGASAASPDLGPAHSTVPGSRATPGPAAVSPVPVRRKRPVVYLEPSCPLSGSRTRRRNVILETNAFELSDHTDEARSHQPSRESSDDESIDLP